MVVVSTQMLWGPERSHLMKAPFLRTPPCPLPPSGPWVYDVSLPTRKDHGAVDARNQWSKINVKAPGKSALPWAVLLAERAAQLRSSIGFENKILQMECILRIMMHITNNLVLSYKLKLEPLQRNTQPLWFPVWCNNMEMAFGAGIGSV